MNGFNVAAKWALVCVLLCGSVAPVLADEQPVLPAMSWRGGGPGTGYPTPQAAFAAYQSWLSEQHVRFFVDSLRICTDADKPEEPGFIYKYNAVDVFYCWTFHDLDGSSPGTAGDITMDLTCPREKPVMSSKPRTPLPQPPNVGLQLVLLRERGATRATTAETPV